MRPSRGMGAIRAEKMPKASRNLRDKLNIYAGRKKSTKVLDKSTRPPGNFKRKTNAD